MLVLFDFSTRADHDLALTGQICLFDSVYAVNDSGCREIGTLDELHQRESVAIGVFHAVNDRVNDLAEVVGRDIRCHTDRDTDRAVYKQVREARGENARLVKAVVEVFVHYDNVLFDVLEHLIRNFCKSCLGVTVSRRRVAVDRTEVTVSLNKGVAQREILRHSYHRAVNRGVTVGMITSKNVTDGSRRFVESVVACQVILIHCPEDASLTRLHTVAHVGESTRGDYRH